MTPDERDLLAHLANALESLQKLLLDVSRRDDVLAGRLTRIERALEALAASEHRRAS